MWHWAGQTRKPQTTWSHPLGICGRSVSVVMMEILPWYLSQVWRQRGPLRELLVNKGSQLDRIFFFLLGGFVRTTSRVKVVLTQQFSRPLSRRNFQFTFSVTAKAPPPFSKSINRSWLSAMDKGGKSAINCLRESLANFRRALRSYSFAP